MSQPQTTRKLSKEERDKAKAAFRQSWRVGVYTATMVCRPGNSVDIEWWPAVPRMELMDRAMRRKYKAGRLAAAEALARITGGLVLLFPESVPR